MTRWILLSMIGMLAWGCQAKPDERLLEAALRSGDFLTVETVLRQDWKARHHRESLRKLYAQALVQHHWFDVGMGLDIPDSVVAHRIHEIGRVPDSATDAQVLEIWQSWCDQTLERGDTTKALRRYESFTNLWPRHPIAWHKRAVLSFQTGDWETARQCFARGIELDSNNAVAHFNHGMALWKHGDTREALDRWLAALRKDPENQDFAYWVGRAALKLKK